MKTFNPQNIQIAESILKHRNKTSNAGYNQKAVADEVAPLFPGVTTRKSLLTMVSRVAVSLRKNKWKILPVTDGSGDGHKEDKENKEDKTPLAIGGQVELVGIKTKIPPFTFIWKGDDIAMSPTDTFECYIFYLDMKARLGLTDTFSECLKVAMSTLWQLTFKPKIDGEVIKYA